MKKFLSLFAFAVLALGCISGELSAKCKKPFQGPPGPPGLSCCPDCSSPPSALPIPDLFVTNTGQQTFELFPFFSANGGDLLTYELLGFNSIPNFTALLNPASGQLIIENFDFAQSGIIGTVRVHNTCGIATSSFILIGESPPGPAN